jgi:hypothetical protein
MLKKAVQQGRSERRCESYSGPYGEPLSDARTLLADIFSILLKSLELPASLPQRLGQFPGIPAFLRTALRTKILSRIQFFMC